MRWNPSVVWAVVTIVSTIVTPALSVAEPPVRTIEVSARSDIHVVPDEVILSLSVVTENRELILAKSENDKLTRAVLALADKHDLDEKEFKIDHLGIRPEYEGSRFGGPRKFLGYRVTRDVEISLRDFSIIDPLLSDVLAAGANRVGGILFRTRKHREYQFEARRLAVLYAKEKASHLAKLNGLRLGKALTIEEEVEGDEHTWGMASMMAKAGDNDHRVKVRLVGAGPAKSATAEQERNAADQRHPIAPGQLTISATVTIKFEMLE